jgi:ABC-type glycerol-3-phosphate transport system substrate-binding protein
MMAIALVIGTTFVAACAPGSTPVEPPAAPAEEEEAPAEEAPITFEMAVPGAVSESKLQPVLKESLAVQFGPEYPVTIQGTLPGIDSDFSRCPWCVCSANPNLHPEYLERIGKPELDLFLDAHPTLALLEEDGGLAADYSVQGLNPMLMIYRSDILEEPPQTWEELLVLAQGFLEGGFYVVVKPEAPILGAAILSAYESKEGPNSFGLDLIFESDKFEDFVTAVMEKSSVFDAIVSQPSVVTPDKAPLDSVAIALADSVYLGEMARSLDPEAASLLRVAHVPRFQDDNSTAPISIVKKAVWIVPEDRPNSEQAKEFADSLAENPTVVQGFWEAHGLLPATPDAWSEWEASNDLPDVVQSNLSMLTELVADSRVMEIPANALGISGAADRLATEFTRTVIDSNGKAMTADMLVEEWTKMLQTE